MRLQIDELSPQRHNGCMRCVQVAPPLCAAGDSIHMRLQRHRLGLIRQHDVDTKGFSLAAGLLQEMANPLQSGYAFVIGTDEQKSVADARGTPIGDFATPAEPQRNRTTWSRVDPGTV